MNNAEIQIQFPDPGQWYKFTLIAVYWDADGYTRTDSYKRDDIPADQAPAMASVVAALVGLAEPWQASQVWARLAEVVDYGDNQDNPPTITEAVELTVEAVNPQGGRRTFTVADYSEFALPDPAAVAFFKHFTAA